MTPATPQPRHPLELLADGWEATALSFEEDARAAGEGVVARYKTTRAQELRACAQELNAALRAQAEAEAAAQETVRALVRRSEDMGRCCGCGGEPHPIWENWEHYPGCPLAAALAQAGSTP